MLSLPSGRGAWLAILIVVALASASALSALVPEPSAEQPLQVQVERVPLLAGDPARERVGPLLYRGGLWLRSEDPRFGGLSDLRVSADGSRLWAVSDCGYGLTAALSYDAKGQLSGLGEPRLVELRGPRGRPLSREARDAESLVADADALEVGFEKKSQILAYARDPAFAGPGRRLPVPEGLRHCGGNGGIETMAQLDDGRRFLVCEASREAARDTPAWIGRGDDWTERSYPLLFDGGWAGQPFRPTAAALLPGGDMLALERRFPPIAARLVRISRQDLLTAGEGSPLHPREIARFESPLTLDNFEGIDVRADGAGTLVYLLSDDNNCAKRRGGHRGTGLQRTLLLMLALTGA